MILHCRLRIGHHLVDDPVAALIECLQRGRRRRIPSRLRRGFHFRRGSGSVVLSGRMDREAKADRPPTAMAKRIGWVFIQPCLGDQ